MSLSTDRPIGYPSIGHLASIVEEETTENVPLNPPAEEPLTQEDQKELNFPDIRTFVCHVKSAPKKVYDSVMRLRKHLVLVDKQNQKLKSKFTNYEKANEAYIIDNIQLKAKNDELENWLADLKKQLENARSDKRLTLFLPLPSASLPPLVLVSDDSNGKSKHSHHSHYSWKTKSTRLPNPPMLVDNHATGFDINMWKSKMTKKLVANANHYPTKALRMVYMDSRVDGNAYKHLAARLRIGARKLFATAEEMFEVLQKVYEDSNRAHTAANKFRDLKITRDFNSFWMEFQVLASELDHSKATLIGEFEYKLILLLFWAMASGVS